MSGVKPEPYTRIPARVFRALTARELTSSEAFVLVYLAYRIGRDGGRTHVTLAGLNDEIAWQHSAEQLRKVLHRLGEYWLEVSPPTQGGRSPWRFALAGAQVGPAELQLASNGEQLSAGETDESIADHEPAHLQPGSSLKSKSKSKSDDELDQLFDRVGFTATQRVRARLQERGRVVACLEHAIEHGDSPAALAHSLIDSDQWPSGRGDRDDSPHEQPLADGLVRCTAGCQRWSGTPDDLAEHLATVHALDRREDAA